MTNKPNYGQVCLIHDFNCTYNDIVSCFKSTAQSVIVFLAAMIGETEYPTQPMLPETSAHWRTLQSRYKTQRYIIYTTRSNNFFFTSSHSIMQFKRFPSLISFMFAILLATSLASTYVSWLAPNTRLSYTDWLTWLQQHCCIGHYSPPKSRVLRGLP
jgi:hypothetical protein